MKTTPSIVKREKGKQVFYAYGKFCAVLLLFPEITAF